MPTLTRAIQSFTLTFVFVFCAVTGFYPFSHLTVWAILVSGSFWWLASMFPIWGRDMPEAPAMMNCVAASTAVFAGLTAVKESELELVRQVLSRLMHAI